MHKVARSVVMVHPLTFCSNPETLESNSFQSGNTQLAAETVLKQAQNEFTEFQSRLTQAGIGILKFNEVQQAETPDALFPNNWFCHLPDGRVFIFPMQAKNRQRECRDDVIHSLKAKEVIDLRYLADEGVFLEGTGSLILDHRHKIGYACLSPRTSAKALDIFSEFSGYKIIAFDSLDENNKPVYHTNVMMALGNKNAVINLSSIKNRVQQNEVVQALNYSGHHIVDISNTQMNNFAGNMLFLSNTKNEFFWVCSKKAFDALTPENRKALESEAQLIFAPLDTIETYGGGGARCLMAEVFN